MSITGSPARSDATISVDLADPTPPYEQLRRQLVQLIETGQLRAGERLPHCVTWPGTWGWRSGR